MIILGRVIMGDIAVILVDLAQRHLLRVEEIDGTDDSSDWLLAPAEDAPGGQITGYEKKLLDKLAGPEQARLSLLKEDFGRELGRIRSALEHQATARGWVRRLQHDHRTPAGEEAARQLRSFHRDLRRLKSAEGEEALHGDLLPYALRFGLVTGAEPLLARFAHAWVDAFGDLPGWRRDWEQDRTVDTDAPMFGQVPPGAGMVT